MAKKANNEPNAISQESIARRAYELWESEGRPEGRAADHWVQAEEMLRVSASNSDVTASAPRARKQSAPRLNGRREKSLEMVS